MLVSAPLLFRHVFMAVSWPTVLESELPPSLDLLACIATNVQSCGVHENALLLELNIPISGECRMRQLLLYFRCSDRWVLPMYEWHPTLRKSNVCCLCILYLSNIFWYEMLQLADLLS